MNIQPIAYFHSPMTSKFGIPRQSGVANGLLGRIVLEPPYRQAEAVRGLEEFSHLWIIWEFSANKPESSAKQHEATRLTVRPPRLGGNERIGVFASRSPFRPNNLGLSCVHISRIEMTAGLGPVIHVEGADLMDGTPIYDLKPYVAYADAHSEARCGFVDQKEWKPLPVDLPDVMAHLFTEEERLGLVQVLAQDPRPPYHNDPQRVYGMPYAGYDVRFRVSDGRVIVCEMLELSKSV